MADLDHRFMTPPSLRVSGLRQAPLGDAVLTWDLRIAQPNVSHVAMPVVHSLEHFLGSYLRSASEAVIAVVPMGCQTGFYIVTTDVSFEFLADLLASALEAVLAATAVPLATSTECGWAENHSLAGVQALASWLLSRQAEWPEPGPLAREV